MKKTLLTLLIIIFVFPVIAKEYKYRVSFSNTKQAKLEKKQGGLLIRINQIALGDTAWQFDEFWIKKNTKGSELRQYILTEFPGFNKTKLNNIIANYTAKVTIDTTIAGEFAEYRIQKELNNKLIKIIKQLDKRVRKLEVVKQLETVK